MLLSNRRDEHLGLCRYCQTKAGLFKYVHETCSKDAEQALKELDSLAGDAIKTMTGDGIASGRSALQQKGRLTDTEVRKALLRAADMACMSLAHEHPVSDEDADRIGEVFKAIEPDWFKEPAKLVHWHGYCSLLLSNTLYEVLHGQNPYFDPSTPISFRLGRDEHPIIKRNATLAEYKTVSSGGGYQSVSLPIGGGMYYRLGTSVPRSQQTGLVPVDTGEFLVTTKALYFGGQKDTFRIPFSSILRLESFADGVGVYENYGGGKVFIPFTLGFDDGWFFYNLVAALVAQAADSVAQ